MFHQPYLSCTKCHAAGDSRDDALGPDLAKLGKDVTDLLPDRVGPETLASRQERLRDRHHRDRRRQDVTGLLAGEDRPTRSSSRPAARTGNGSTIPKKNIDERKDSGPSIMPAGLVNATGVSAAVSRPDSLPPWRSPTAAPRGRGAQARPVAGRRPALPAYECDIDHAGLIAELGRRRASSAARRSTIASASIATARRTSPAPCRRRSGSPRARSRTAPIRYSMYRR